jgi:hypothetical protein
MVLLHLKLQLMLQLHTAVVRRRRMVARVLLLHPRRRNWNERAHAPPVVVLIGMVAAMAMVSSNKSRQHRAASDTLKPLARRSRQIKMTK